MEVRIAPGETIESALRRFKKATQKAGVLAEARKHEHYEKPSVRRKKKSAAARKARLARKEISVQPSEASVLAEDRAISAKTKPT